MKVLVGLICYLVLLKIFLVPLFPFFVSILLYIILRPLIIYLSRTFHVKSKIIGFIILFLFFLSITILMTYIFVKTYTFMHIYLNHYPLNIHWFIDVYKIIPELHSFISYIIAFVLDTFSNLIRFIPSIFFFVFIMCLSAFYLVFELEYIKGIVLYFTDLKTYNIIKKIISICIKTIQNYCKIQLIIMLLTFLILSFVLFVLDIEYALFYSFLFSILDCLPFVGVGIGLIPLMIYLLYKQMYLKCIYLFLVFVFLTLMRSIIETNMMKSSIKIPSFVILLSMIIHIYIYGLSGVVLSILHMNIIFGYLEYRKSNYKMI